jgi:primosomal protein N' (replication factor Y)
MKYAEVVVNTPLRRQPKAVVEGYPPEGATAYRPLSMTFHYSIPPYLQDEVALGQLVWVPFGPRRLQGVIMGFSDTAPVEETKDLHQIVDPQSVLLPPQIELAHWISETTLAPLINCVLLMLPPGVEQRVELVVQLNPDVPIPDGLPPKQRAIVQLLQREGTMKLRQVGRAIKMPGWRSVVDQLVRKGVVIKRSELQAPRVRPKMERVARLLVELDETVRDQLQRAPRQRAIVEVLAEQGEAPVTEVYAQVGGSSATLKALVEKGFIALEEQEVWRDPLEGRTFVPTVPPRLTPDQEAAWWEMEEGIRDKGQGTRDKGLGTRVYLLHGVTGSGKTELYLRALGEVLAQGRQAIVLVPEIALTPQTIRRFAARFPGRIAVAHSKLSLGERYDGWRRMRDGEVDVVIGSRSAVFAPLPRLGLIVLDEEHEWSYKQEKMPRYHARDVALKYAELTGAVVILGSATPSVESYYRAQRGEYKLLRLPQRIMGHRRRIEEQRARYQVAGIRYQVVGEGYEESLYAEMPPVQVVDLRQELRAGNRSIFSRALQEAMTVALAAGEQVILFLNRRGAATFIMCRDCGHVLKCPRCEVPLTYHLAEDDLICHHCNLRTFVPQTCPNCWSGRIKFFGIGTQKVEQVTRQLFPQARIVRWDRDTTGGKLSHEEFLRQFIERRADVMIGTQMIAKGLDLPLVTLVGVVTADTALHLPDFRAGERTFQILTQVAGRAGRSILGGKVIIQTYTPEHYGIQAASRHDYESFYQQELAFRREQGYPPFSRLVKLVYIHRDERRCQEEAEKLHRVLRNKIARLGLPGVDLIGPAPCFFRRLRGQYRWQIIVRGQDPHPLLQDLALPLGWRVDVDPVSVL